MKTANGITLIEVLVAISIVLILTLLTSAFFKNMRERAEAVTTIQQLKSIFVGLTAYAGDNEGRIPAIQRDLDEEGNSIPRPDMELPNTALDLPRLMTHYNIPESTFLSSANKKEQHYGYYDVETASSYAYFGTGQRLDGYSINGTPFPLNEQYLLSEIKNWHNGKSYHLLGNGTVTGK